MVGQQRSLWVKVISLTLSSALNELRNRGNAIVRQVAVVGHSIQTRTWASLIIGAWGYERIRASSIDVLRLSIEGRGAVCSLSLFTTGTGACFFELL